MRLRPGGVIAALIVVALALTGCSDTSAQDEGGSSDVATVEPIEGSDVARVTCPRTPPGGSTSLRRRHGAGWQ